MPEYVVKLTDKKALKFENFGNLINTNPEILICVFLNDIVALIDA
jgi:hypothetical protein